jgi:hypothetical protein
VKEAVRAAFVPFTLPLEGALPGHMGITWMYPDVKNLVSTGLGNLIDPVGLALGLPFIHLDGTPASRDEIAAEWHRIKNLPPDTKGRTAAQLGHLYAKPFTTLRLTNAGIEQLVNRKLAENESVVATIFKEWASWPADAQLATHSMAWACGAGIFSPRAGRAHWPKLTAALHALDFRTAAVECFMPEERTIGGLRPRNKANRILYSNAAVALHRLDPDVLFYPQELDAEYVPLDTPTEPVLVPEMRPDPLGHVIDFRKVYSPPPLRGQEDDDSEPDPAA